MKQIFKIDKKLFKQLQEIIEARGVSGDKSSFFEIRNNLNNPKILTADEFAEELTYVVLTSGFRQQTARKIFDKIMDCIKSEKLTLESLLKIFNNRLKDEAILKIWNNKEKFRNEFYNIKDDEEKIRYLKSMPYVGDITKYHIARNLGVNVVKYDIWIQKLGVCLEGCENDVAIINNQKLPIKIKNLCDNMFSKLERELGEKRGFIDVVLWRSCEQGIFKIENNKLYLEV